MIIDSLKFILSIVPFIAQGLTVTLQISLTGFVLGMVLGVFFGLGRISSNIVYHTISSIYVEVIRGTPLFVQILIIYFGLPSLGINLDPITAGILALGINSGAYQAEILRAGIQSIPIEQLNSALSLGMTKTQAMIYVILPQAIRVVIPALVNELVILVKDSALVSVIGVAELTRRGEYVVAWSWRPFKVYSAVAALYFIVCFTLSKASKYLEEKLSIPGYMTRKGM